MHLYSDIIHTFNIQFHPWKKIIQPDVDVERTASHLSLERKYLSLERKYKSLERKNRSFERKFREFENEDTTDNP